MQTGRLCKKSKLDHDEDESSSLPSSNAVWYLLIFHNTRPFDDMGARQVVLSPGSNVMDLKHAITQTPGYPDYLRDIFYDCLAVFKNRLGHRMGQSLDLQQTVTDLGSSKENPMYVMIQNIQGQLFYYNLVVSDVKSAVIMSPASDVTDLLEKVKSSNQFSMSNVNLAELLVYKTKSDFDEGQEPLKSTDSISNIGLSKDDPVYVTVRVVPDQIIWYLLVDEEGSSLAKEDHVLLSPFSNIHTFQQVLKECYGHNLLEGIAPSSIPIYKNKSDFEARQNQLQSSQFIHEIGLSETDPLYIVVPRVLVN